MEHLTAILFVNAGARLLGSPHADLHVFTALELFRGALETKLVEVGGSTSGPLPTASSNDGVVVENEVIQRAVFHLQNVEKYLTIEVKDGMVEAATESGALGLVGPVALMNQSLSTKDVTVPRQSRGYEPYLCKMPFSLPEDCPVSITLLSCAIVYNIGLAYQWMDRDSPKTEEFYTIAAALLLGAPFMDANANGTTLLRISLLNNYGVWCYEHGSGDSMRVCMERAAALLHNERAEAGQ